MASKRSPATEDLQHEDESVDLQEKLAGAGGKDVPSTQDSLGLLSTCLGGFKITEQNFVYVANISVRAHKEHVVEVLQPLGNLLAFEFVIRDKMFRFQAGLAIFKDSQGVIEELKAKPTVLFKRKLRIFDLASRKNSSTLLAIMAKKVSTAAADKAKDPTENRSAKVRKPSSAATASDHETLTKRNSAPSSQPNLPTTYTSTLRGCECRLLHTEENLTFRRGTRVSAAVKAFQASRIQSQSGFLAVPSRAVGTATRALGCDGYRLF